MLARPIRTRQIEEIAGMGNPVLRNLWITQAYHELSAELFEMLGGQNVNWCTFAAWASKTAGESIRDQELPRPVIELAERIGFADEALDICSKLIADGNLKVFAELGREYARMIETFQGDTKYDEAKLIDFLAGVRVPAGETPIYEGRLKIAFVQYYKVMFELDQKKKAEMILYGSALAGYHEQMRLQPDIKGAIDAPFDEDSGTNKKHLISALLHSSFVRKYCEGIWDDAVTRFLMHIDLPDSELSLGESVAPPAHQPVFPPDLQTLRNEDLVAFVDHFGDRMSTMKGSGAGNWTKISDRMRFIIDLFRSYQQDKTLLTPPFTPEQIASMEAGRIPEGKL
jgi:hypothetical protein